jgi:hypothetical protein
LAAANAAVIFFAGINKNNAWAYDFNNGFHSKRFI